MPSISGTVVAAPITTGNTALGFSIGDTDEMQGGHHQVADSTARDAIPAARRKEGMQCWVVGDAAIYRLVGGILNANWVRQPPGNAYSLGSPEGVVVGFLGQQCWDGTNKIMYVKDSGDGTNTGWRSIIS